MSDGFFFNTKTMEPLFNGPGWTYAFEIWSRLFATRGPEVGYNKLFKSGRCAFVIHYTGGLKWSTKSGVVARKDTAGNKLWVPSVTSGLHCYPAGRPGMPSTTWATSETREMRHYVNVGVVSTEYCTPRTMTFPGSKKVVTWSSSTPRLETCSVQTCPHADDSGVNRAPFWPEGGWSWSLSATASDVQKKMLFTFFAYHYSPPVSRQWATMRPQMDQHRYSHVTPPSEVQSTYIKYNFPPVAYHDFVTVAQQSFSSLNTAFDLQVPGYNQYWSSMNRIMGETYGTCTVDTCRNASELLSLNTKVRTDAHRAWTAITAQYGRLAQLTVYRQSLGISAALSQADKCANFADEVNDCVPSRW